MPQITPTIDEFSRSILIVDDDRIIVQLLSAIFDKYGFRVFEASDGLEGWHVFNSELIDIVLTDILMPGLTGKELAYRIRKRSPSTKIAVMTGGETEVAAELMHNGTADYFFLKPFDIKSVCEMLAAETEAA
ncbi:MAG: response regulator [Anaerolineales bacterium]|jgi:DNA-binding NtrC family response regulator